MSQEKRKYQGSGGPSPTPEHGSTAPTEQAEHARGGARMGPRQRPAAATFVHRRDLQRRQTLSLTALQLFHAVRVLGASRAALSAVASERFAGAGCGRRAQALTVAHGRLALHTLATERFAATHLVVGEAAPRAHGAVTQRPPLPTTAARGATAVRTARNRRAGTDRARDVASRALIAT